jgi:hypothetical protein
MREIVGQTMPDLFANIQPIQFRPPAGLLEMLWHGPDSGQVSKAKH